jgi:poly(A) polymerase Pap1
MPGQLSVVIICKVKLILHREEIPDQIIIRFLRVINYNLKVFNRFQITVPVYPVASW